MNLPNHVSIVEVGPRDGLQNEADPVSLNTKVELVNRLSRCGLQIIETGAFVNPRWVPQMADSAEVFASICRHDGTEYTALIPNQRGFDSAREAQADQVAIFTAASESFSRKNTNCTIQESIERFAPVAAAAKLHNIPLRGYISCVIDCPYEGRVAPERVTQLTQQLLDLGCYEVSLGDTIGTGTPASFRRLLNKVLERVPANRLAVHCHDTYGMAIANIDQALSLGISVVDSSIAGLGGCPYAPGASGNVATEDVVYLLDGYGIEHGIDRNALVATGEWISQALNRPNGSKAGAALLRSQGLNTLKAQ